MRTCAFGIVFFNWASPENVSRLHDPVLVANIRVSLVQGSMLLQLNVVIVAFLINIDKKKCVTLFFSLFRFGGTLHVDSSTDGVLASHAMVMKGEEVFFIFALDTPFYIVKSYNNVFT